MAIVLAGAWAIYTFIYNDNIRPYQSPPTLVVVAKLEPVGAKGSLQAIKLTQALRNAGSVAFRFLATANVVSGERVLGGNAKAVNLSTSDSDVTFARGVVRAKSEVAFSFARRFAGAGASRATDFTLDPGESVTTETIFYIPRGRYDGLRYQGRYAFTKQMHETEPVDLVRSKDGSLALSPRDPQCAQTPPTGCRLTQTTAASTLSLWPRN